MSNETDSGLQDPKDLGTGANEYAHLGQVPEVQRAEAAAYGEKPSRDSYENIKKEYGYSDPNMLEGAKAGGEAAEAKFDRQQQDAGEFVDRAMQLLEKVKTEPEPSDFSTLPDGSIGVGLQGPASSHGEFITSRVAAELAARLGVTEQRAESVVTPFEATERLQNQWNTYRKDSFGVLATAIPGGTIEEFVGIDEQTSVPEVFLVAFKPDAVESASASPVEN